MRSALISTDAAVRETLRRTLALDGRGLEFSVEIAVPFGEISEEQITELRNADPQLVFLDFDGDIPTAIGLARFLIDGGPQRIIIATGPALSSQELLDAMRAGIVEYLPKPLGEDAAKAALERAARRLGWTATSRDPGQLYAVFSPKGGAGTTSVATNLAIVLHRLTGKKTLLVDLDLELGEVAVQLGARPRYSLVDLVQNFYRIDAGLLATYIEHHASGVDFLSAPFHPETVDAAGHDQIRGILHYLKRQYDYIVVDTPKSFSLDSVAAFEEADRILLVTTVDVPSLRNLQRCLPLLERVAGKERERLRLVVNRYHPDDLLTLDDLQKTVGIQVHWTLSNDYETVSRSINSGAPVAGNGGKSKYARDLQTLGAELAGVPATGGVARASGARLMGILGRLRRRPEEKGS
ncbi:MAG TPA: AAA family ATPase [Gemmatimonadales bacterium]